jgi:nicotinate-nucleotide pyrophosphorylase (carboxylating)
MFSAAETAACRRLIAWAIEEDLGVRGDLTSQALIPADRQGRAVFVARSAGVLAGLPAVSLVLAAVDARLSLEPHRREGDRLERGDRIATASGPMRSLLTAERTALNFLQHLSGIATLTRRYVDAVGELPCKVLDTRKTLPGWRLLEKYAVRQGGGHNHRLGLHDGVLIKDNHLAALQDPNGSIAAAVTSARQAVGASMPIEIEVDTLEQLEEALAQEPEIILLDNMSPEDLREAVRLRDVETAEERYEYGSEIVQLEASGGVTLETVRAIAETGVDRISVGALTHSAPALDIALDYQSKDEG